MIMDNPDHEMELNAWLQAALKAEREKLRPEFAKVAAAIKQDRESVTKLAKTVFARIDDLTASMQKALENHIEVNNESTRIRNSNTDAIEIVFGELQTRIASLENAIAALKTTETELW